MTFARLVASLVLALGTACWLAGCSGSSEHAETLEQVNQHIAQQQYAPALDLLMAALKEDPKDVELRRAHVTLFILADSPDSAYESYKYLSEINAGDPVLNELLSHENPKVRITTARTLGRLGSTDSIPGLTRAIGDSDREVRRAAVAALGEIRAPEATKVLLGGLKDEWWSIRSESALALGKIRDPQASEALFAVLTDSDATVRLNAENALLTLAGESETDPQVFASRVEAPEADVRRIALVGMAIQGDKASTPGLIELAGDEDVKTRGQAIRALGKTTDPAALATVRQALDDPQWAVKAQAIEALGLYGDAQSLDKLQSIADDPAMPPAIQDRALAAIDLIRQGS